MKILRLLVFLLLVYPLQAQNKITSFEYWLDGNYQNKITKNVTPAEEFNHNEDLDISAVSNGFHLFHIRYADENGKWSSSISQVFFKMDNQGGDTNEIVEYEYWVDKYESRVVKQLNAGSEIVFDDFIDVSTLGNGFHTLYLRFKDAGGNWSPVVRHVFFKMGNSNYDTNLVKAYRYWFDNDFQNAVEVVLPKPVETSEVNLLVEIPNQTTEAFNIQFLDEGNLWSSVYTKKFTPEANFDIFYTLNTFSFTNQTAFGESYLWDFGDGKKSNLVHPTYTYEKPGVYDVCLIASNKLGKDTLCKTVYVYGLRELSPQKAGNTGEVTMFLYGAGFDKNTKVTLIDKNGNKIIPQRIQHFKLDALKCYFDLRDKPIGTYDVVAELAGKEYKLENAFTIEQGGKAEPFVTITGRNRVLIGRWQTFELNFGNKGNVDAVGVPLVLIFSESAGLEVEFPELILNQNPMLQSDTNYQKVLKTLPDYFKINSLFDEPFNGRVYYLYIPSIPANYTGSMKFRFKSDKDLQIYAWVTEPYFASPLDKRVEWCIRLAMLKALKDGLIDIGLSEAPVLGCINQIWSNYLEPSLWEAGLPDPDPSYNRPKSWKETIYSWGNSALDLTMVLVNCAKDFIAPLKAYSIAVQIITLINDIKKNYLTDKDCREKYKSEPKEQKKINTVTSLDPNEIVGPAGFNMQNYVSDNIGFNYAIYFENLKSATAPAQEVVIVDTLDPNVFDFQTFSFGRVTWGGNQIIPLPNLKEFTIDVSLKPKNPNLLRINGSFDTTTGIVRWHFMTLDSAKMDFPEDPMGGFLPPNVNSPEGEGSVSFKINKKNSLVHNTELKNKAVITFDFNQPIETNTYINHLDLIPPTSKLTHIYKISYMQPNYYKITGTASDDGSGVAYRTVFASINDGEYFPLATMNSDEIFVQLEPDSVYKFYSIAVDSVGNFESDKDNFEVSTLSVGVEPFETNEVMSIKISPNPVAKILTLNCDLLQSGYLSIYLNDFSGRNVFFDNVGFVSNGKFSKEYDLSEISNGRYILTFRHNGKQYVKIITIMK